MRLAGRLGLTGDHTLGATHALNGDKILPINPFSGAPRATLRWRYRMGAGLGTLKLECEPARAPEAPERGTRRSAATGVFRLSRTAGASAS